MSFFETASLCILFFVVPSSCVACCCCDLLYVVFVLQAVLPAPATSPLATAADPVPRPALLPATPAPASPSAAAGGAGAGVGVGVPALPARVRMPADSRAMDGLPRARFEQLEDELGTCHS